MVELPSTSTTPLEPGETYQVQIDATDAELWRIQQYIRTHPSWKRALETYVAQRATTGGRVEVLGSGVQNNSQHERVYAITFRALGSGGGSSGGRAVVPAGVDGAGGIYSAAAVPLVAIYFGVFVAGLLAIGFVVNQANESYRLFLLEKGVDVPPRGDSGIGRGLSLLGWAGLVLGAGYVLKQLGAFRT